MCAFYVYLYNASSGSRKVWRISWNNADWCYPTAGPTALIDPISCPSWVDFTLSQFPTAPAILYPCWQVFVETPQDMLFVLGDCSYWRLIRDCSKLCHFRERDDDARACFCIPKMIPTQITTKKIHYRFAIILTLISTHSTRNKRAPDKETDFAILAQISVHTSINKHAHDKETVLLNKRARLK